MTTDRVGLLRLADKEKTQQINHWEEIMRPFMTILMLSLCLLMPPLAQAQHFPDRPITIVNALAAGTGMDTVVRLYGAQLAKSFGQPVVIENKPGAAGVLAIEALMNAPPDGYI